MSDEERRAKARAYYHAHKAEIAAKRHAKYVAHPRVKKARLVPVLTPKKRFKRLDFMKGIKGRGRLFSVAETPRGRKRRFNPYREGGYKRKEQRAHAAMYF